MKPLNLPTLFIISLTLVLGMGLYAYLSSPNIQTKVTTNTDFRTELKTDRTSSLSSPSSPIETSTTTISEETLNQPVSSTDAKSIVTAAGASATQSPKQTQKTESVKVQGCSGSFSSELLCEVNNYRKRHGLNSLTLKSSLTQVAQDYTSWMNETNTFSHTGIIGSNFSERCANAGITCRAENLAEGYPSAQAVVNAWKLNPGHNKNLLGPYTTAGIGIDNKYIAILFN